MTTTASPPLKKPFAVQAAQFTFWAPFIGLGLGFVLNAAMSNHGPNEPTGMMGSLGTSLVLFATNMLLDVSAIILGIVALLGIKKHGAKGILIRSLIGMSVSGLILLATAWIFLNPPGNVFAKSFVGTWRQTNQPNEISQVETRLALRADKHGVLTMRSPAKSIELTGEWRVVTAGGKPTRLQMRWDDGHDPAFGNGIEWDINNIEPNRLSLGGKQPDGSQAPEVYERESP